MIKYKLKCSNCEIAFDSWFASSAEYEKLKKRKLLVCHYCNSTKVDKTFATGQPADYLGEGLINPDFELLTAENFAIETNLIGVGAFITAYQNIYRYLKLPVLKTFFFIFFDIFNKILQHLSKDHWKYYCGVHITCVKK